MRYIVISITRDSATEKKHYGIVSYKTRPLLKHGAPPYLTVLQIPHSSTPLPNPTRPPHPLAIRSSNISLLDVPIPTPLPPGGIPEAPVSQPIHHPPPSLSSLSLFPLRFLFPWNFSDPEDRELAYDSGSSAKLIRLGVVRPEPGADELPRARATPPITMSGMLRVVEEGLGVVEIECCFIEECLGGDGGRVEEEWVDFV